MSTYRVSIIYGASKTVTVEADNPEAALQAGYKLGYVSLCHQCSREIEMGEMIGAEVSDERGEIVIRDMP